MARKLTAKVISREKAAASSKKPRRGDRLPARVIQRKDLKKEIFSDPEAKDALIRLLMKAVKRLVKRGAQNRRRVWKLMKQGTGRYLLHLLLSAVARPARGLTQRQRDQAKKMAMRIKRWKAPELREAQVALRRAGEAPTQRKTVWGNPDRRLRLSDFVKSLTGEYCDQEIAMLLTATRRACGYNKKQAYVSPKSLVKVRKRDTRGPLRVRGSFLESVPPE